jgi:hypothetical protein
VVSEADVVPPLAYRGQALEKKLWASGENGQIRRIKMKIPYDTKLHGMLLSL